MNDIALSSDARRSRWIRSILLAMTLLTSPALCCGSLQLLDSLPAAWLPSSLDFMVNLFESTAHVENKTSQTLYITAITTTYGDPRVIPQNIAFRQRDIPVRPQSSVALQYDSADLPLAGIVVCRNSEDCRLLLANNSGVYELNAYDSLEGLEPDWLDAVQARPVHNYAPLMITAFSLIPIFLFSGWVYLNWSEKKKAG
jgi:hypothetical protein